MRRKRNNAGFTLVEVVVAVAIMAVLAAVALPIFLTQQPDQVLKEATSELAANIRFARGLAISGGTAGGVTSPDFIEVQFDVANRQYSVVAFEGAASGVVKVASLADYHPGRIDMNASTPVIRFQRNGAADRVGTVTLSQEVTGKQRVVEITRAGLARLQ